MQSIKSYTDLEQSKKLAEILPLDSADMMYQQYETVIGDNYGYDYRIQPFFSSDIDGISCWSLAALLELLPKRLQIEDNVCELSVYLYGLYYWNITNGNPCFESKYKDNLVDACYEMIIRLHELNLL